MNLYVEWARKYHIFLPIFCIFAPDIYINFKLNHKQNHR